MIVELPGAWHKARPIRAPLWQRPGFRLLHILPFRTFGHTMPDDRKDGLFL